MASQARFMSRLLPLLALLASSHLFAGARQSRRNAPATALDYVQEEWEPQEEGQDLLAASSEEDLTSTDLEAMRRTAHAPLGLRRRHLARQRVDRADSGGHMSLVGLRRIHRRRPEFESSLGPNDEGDFTEARGLAWPSWQQTRVANITINRGGQRPGKRSPPTKSGFNNEDESKRFDRNNDFLYLVSPVGRQILPIQSDKLAQGFKSLLPLAGGNYEIGLRKYAAPAPPSTLLAGFGHSNELAPIGAGPERERFAGATSEPPTGCGAIKSSVELTKDELGQASGQLVRRCKGRVELSACEGSCASSITPSVKSASGFIKRCTCCNEGAFRRVQVRLSDCFVPMRASESGQQLVSEPGSHMDVEVDEPIDCMCRQCDSIL